MNPDKFKLDFVKSKVPSLSGSVTLVPVQCTEKPYIITEDGIEAPSLGCELLISRQVNMNLRIAVLDALNDAYKLGYEKNRFKYE